jgi:hypothetical protein
MEAIYPLSINTDGYILLGGFFMLSVMFIMFWFVIRQWL